MNTETQSRWSLTHTGNRVLLAVVLGLGIYVLTRSVIAWLIASVLVYLLATLVSRVSRANS